MQVRRTASALLAFAGEVAHFSDLLKRVSLNDFNIVENRLSDLGDEIAKKRRQLSTIKEDFNEEMQNRQSLQRLIAECDERIDHEQAFINLIEKLIIAIEDEDEQSANRWRNELRQYS